jgi:hypothetical protein
MQLLEQFCVMEAHLKLSWSAGMIELISSFTELDVALLIVGLLLAIAIFLFNRWRDGQFDHYYPYA